MGWYIGILNKMISNIIIQNIIATEELLPIAHSCIRGWHCSTWTVYEPSAGLGVKCSSSFVEIPYMKSIHFVGAGKGYYRRKDQGL
mmetsp:Transcript_26347/g.23253  ORF Transcript_26347/g.23253 Transcript_26347/m.23253 type:complete len:86 (-) Transcript_26347:89-346(-)